MAENRSRSAPKALLAFGRRVSPEEAFEELVATRGWQIESWEPTFVEPCDREECLDDNTRVLRPGEPVPPGAEPRLVVASASELPTLYFVGWHYIDFVLSCVGTVSEAARVLGVRRSTLQRKRKKTPPDR